MELLSLIPSFGGLLWTLAAFVLALSIIVGVHEYGHYIVGRWSGIHAEVFSIGFGPKIAGWTDRRGTHWQIAALPLGGYVRFAGDADAASVTAAPSATDAAARRRTLTGAPLWARAATIAAGPVFNFIFAALVFAALLLVRGVPLEAPVVGETKPLPVAHELVAGDLIRAIEGQPVETRADLAALTETLPERDLLRYAVERAGALREVAGPHPLPPLVDAVAPDSAAGDVGLMAGDVVLAIDGAPVATFAALRRAVENSEGRPLALRIWREGTGEFDLVLVPRRTDVPTEAGFESRLMIGVVGAGAFAPQTATPGPFEALSHGVAQTADVITTSLSGLWHMIAGRISTCNLGGPVRIAETSAAAAEQGLASFVWFVAMLSAAIGLMNLFPVPVLDGGHLVLIGWEAATGRAPPEKVLRGLLVTGLALLLSLMVFATANDVGILC